MGVGPILASTATSDVGAEVGMAQGGVESVDEVWHAKRWDVRTAVAKLDVHLAHSVR